MSEFIGGPETWQGLFKRQTDSGRFWKELHGDEFERQSFLMRADAHHICYKSQSDILKKLAKRLKKQGVDEKVIEEIKKIEHELWQGPDSVNECTKAFSFKK